MVGEYLTWNELIARRFFRPEMEGREVILFTDKEIINNIGEQIGKGYQDFIDAIREGPEYLSDRFSGDVIRKAIGSSIGWRGTGRKCPPYVAYLAFFVSAATISGDYNPNSYYPKIVDLLGEGDSRNMSQRFSGVDDLWADLERWSQEDKGERYGRFIKRRRGGYTHVGHVYSQTILSQKERNALPDFFSACEFDQTDPPDEEELRYEMLRKKSFFQPRTLGLLTDEGAPEMVKSLRDALFELILSDLEQWDGASSSDIDPTEAVRGCTSRICLNLDPDDSSILISSLRLKFNLEKIQFPDRPIELTSKGGGGRPQVIAGHQMFVCSQANLEGWSSHFRMDENNGKTMPADALDWNMKYVFVDEGTGIKATFRPSMIRAFLPGHELGTTDDWVESRMLKGTMDFLIACHPSYKEKVEAWGVSSTDVFEEDGPHQQGLPKGWLLFRGYNAKRSSKELQLYVPQKSNIKLIGGLNLRGNEYLEFAPPAIELDGGVGSAVLRINGAPVEAAIGAKNRWTIPKSIGPGIINLEVEVDGVRIWGRRLTLVAPTIISDIRDVPKHDRMGSLIQAEGTTGFVQGVLVNGLETAAIAPAPRGLPTYLSSSIVFIGRSPGLIASWPDDGLPKDWKPVWALAKRKKEWEAYFCGSPEDLSASPPLKGAQGDRRSTKAWKEHLWVNRMKTIPPYLPRLRRLWQEYQAVAKNVR